MKTSTPSLRSLVGTTRSLAGALTLCAALLAVSAAPSQAEVRLPNLLTDNAVLQREKPINVWGWAAPGEEITVTLAAEKDGAAPSTAKAKANEKGEWKATLPAHAVAKADAPLALTVAASNTIVLKNLLVGDVWVCGGQSNMEWGLGACNDKPTVDTADYPNLRSIRVTRRPALKPEADIVPLPGGWRVCAPNIAAQFSAVGFYFAQAIQKELGEKAVPIGLLESNWGGTMIEPWTSPAGFAAVPELVAYGKKAEENLQNGIAKYRETLTATLDQTDAWIKESRQALESGAELPRPDTIVQALGSNPASRPDNFLLYNGMIAPLANFPVKGAIWYQGESNGGDSTIYAHKTQALLNTWRGQWGAEMPLYWVQLAGFGQPNPNPAGGDGWARIRIAQRDALSIPHTGMASALDIGEANDIHPKNKSDVGKRLALWALANDYGVKGLVVSGPLYTGFKVEAAKGKKGAAAGKIRIEFDKATVGGGLIVGKKVGLAPTEPVKGGKLARFAIAGEDQKWVWADAVIDGDTVVVSSPEVPAPVAVRYAFSQNPEGANLYNKAGLPASPFRTDDWKE